jgi:GNAT superfamily N-acetyltransferase
VPGSSAAAFATDPHTIVKQLGRKPYDTFTISRSCLEENLKWQNFVCVEAVDNQGIVVGHASWVFSDGGQRHASSRGADHGESAAAGEDKAAESDRPRARGDEAEEGDPIERLHALEEANTQYWLQNLVPTDTPCMFVVGLAVSPSYEGRCIGRALLRHDNAMADERRLSIWVHLSHQAYAAYSKAGFETGRELRIDLDDYAPRPPRDGEATMGVAGHDDNGRWGGST